MAQRLKKKKVGDFIPDDQNANKGTERGRQMIEESLRNLGAGRSILIDKKGKIIAGNKTHEEAGQIGIEDVLVVETDGNQLVAVQRTDLDLDEDEKARELAYYDNRAGQLNMRWDKDQLAKDLEEGLGLIDKRLFTEAEMAAIVDVVDNTIKMKWTEEILEEHQYLVLYFDNSLDWQVARDLFGVETVRALDATDTYRREGLGRVLRGDKVLRMLRKGGVDDGEEG